MDFKMFLLTASRAARYHHLARTAQRQVGKGEVKSCIEIAKPAEVQIPLGPGPLPVARERCSITIREVDAITRLIEGVANRVEALTAGSIRKEFGRSLYRITGNIQLVKGITF